MTILLTGRELTLDQVLRVARGGEAVSVAPAAVEHMRSTRAVVERMAEEAVVYGLTTGVGAQKRVRVRRGESADFNRLLILNHRVGTGPAAPEDVVRGTLLRLANGFASGVPGVRPELAAVVLDALNEDRLPPVRILGSVGQADLAPLADLAHGVVGEFVLEPNEALALLNNNSFSTAWAALALADAIRLVDALDVGGALDLEGFGANVSPLDLGATQLRPYAGLATTREHLVSLLEGSGLWDDGAARNLQDPLTFRNLPQLHGAARDALGHARTQLEIELNASQGNPVVVVDGETTPRIVSGGNFDVVPLAAALDYVRIALAPALTAACERAVKLLQAPLTGLPEGLAARGGLPHDSLIEFGVAAQALTAEARLLAHPVSFELASSTQQESIEGRTTMAPLAARRLAEMVGLGERLVAIELLVAAQAVDLRGADRLGRGTRNAHELIRARIPFTDVGEPIPQDLEPLRDLVRSGTLRG